MEAGWEVNLRPVARLLDCSWSCLISVACQPVCRSAGRVHTWLKKLEENLGWKETLELLPCHPAWRWPLVCGGLSL